MLLARQLVLSAAVAGLVSVSAFAANHPVTRLTSDGNANPKVDTFDLVVSTDEDYDASPAKTIAGLVDGAQTTVTFDRAYITGVLRQTACTLFSATEGRQRVGKVFIYRNGLYDKNVDIQLIAKTVGRSNASAPGWLSKDATTTNYLITQAASGETAQSLESPKSFGLVIVHELMHYLYGMHDEYVEAGKAVDANDPGAPAGTDVAVDSVMHDQTSVQTLSTKADYDAKNSDFTKTAHGRVFGTSVWGAIVRAASEDTGKAAELRRTRFPAFDGMTVPASKQELTQPDKDCAQGGAATAAFNPVFVPNPKVRSYIAVSQALAGEQLDAAKAAAVKVLEKVQPSATTSLAVFALGETTASVFNQALASSTDVDAAKAAINGIAAADGITKTLSEQLATVKTDIESAYSGMTVSEGDALALNLFVPSGGQLTESLSNDFKALRVALNAGETSFSSQGQPQERSARVPKNSKPVLAGKFQNTAPPVMMSLADAAGASGGEYISARNAAELGAKAAAAASEADGDGEELLAYEERDTLAAATPLSVSVPVQATFDTELVFVGGWSEDDDAAKLSFTLRDPAGNTFTPTAANTNQTFANGQIEYEFDMDAQEIFFAVDDAYTGRGGNWTLSVTASAAVANPVILSAAADSALTTESEIVGDVGPEPLLRVKVAGERPLIGAKVTAQIIATRDGTVARTVTALDDGLNGDARKNDGVYSVRLVGLPEGEYDVEVAVEDSDGKATLSSAGVNARGMNVPDVAVTGDFKRASSTVVGIRAASGTVAGDARSATVQSTAGRVSVSTDKGSFTTVTQPSRPAAAPDTGTYPVGFYDFTVTGVTPGDTVTVTFTLPAGTNANGYLKCNTAGTSCAPFAGARISGTTVTLTLVDNGAGDNDPTAGVIRDPGAPMVLASGSTTEDDGFLGLGAFGAWMLPVLLAALGRRRVAARG